jgi:F-box-like
MDTSSTEFRNRLRQTVDDEITSLEDTLRTLKSHRNTLAPISRLPPEALAAIFSFVSSSALDESGHLRWIRVTHVCRQWRQIALNYPRFWSNIDVTRMSPAIMAEILTQAKMAPLTLVARSTHQNSEWFDALWKQLEAHISHTRHLEVEGYLAAALGRLVSSAPVLEFLSLSHQYKVLPSPRANIPNTLFNRTTPSLTHLELNNCDISWKSPLFKGLQTLEISGPSKEGRPGLEDWLDTLNEMSQLKTLALYSATPIASPDTPFKSAPQRTVTLPFLKNFTISSCARDCALALTHLLLPTLTYLKVAVESHELEGDDVRLLTPYVARNANGPQDIEPLRSILISGERGYAEMVAWSVPDVDSRVCDPPTMIEASASARVVFLTKNYEWRFGTDSLIFDDLLTHLPLDSISTLTAHNHTQLNKEVWLRHVPSWPLLERVRLVPTAFRSFREMLASDPPPNGPRLPSLTKLILEEVSLTVQRTYHLCDVLIQRVEQGVPLEALDLCACFGANRAVQLLEEIVVDVQRPVLVMEVGTSSWNEGTRIKIFDDEEGWTEDDDGYDPGPWYENSDEDEDEDWDGEEEDEVDYDDDDYYGEL